MMYQTFLKESPYRTDVVSILSWKVRIISLYSAANFTFSSRGTVLKSILGGLRSAFITSTTGSTGASWLFSLPTMAAFSHATLTLSAIRSGSLKTAIPHPPFMSALTIPPLTLEELIESISLPLNETDTDSTSSNLISM